jgi:hypothetical protein
VLCELIELIDDALEGVLSELKDAEEILERLLELLLELLSELALLIELWLLKELELELLIATDKLDALDLLEELVELLELLDELLELTVGPPKSSGIAS